MAGPDAGAPGLPGVTRSGGAEALAGGLGGPAEADGSPSPPPRAPASRPSPLPTGAWHPALRPRRSHRGPGRASSQPGAPDCRTGLHPVLPARGAQGCPPRPSAGPRPVRGFRTASSAGVGLICLTVPQIPCPRGELTDWWALTGNLSLDHWAPVPQKADGDPEETPSVLCTSEVVQARCRARVLKMPPASRWGEPTHVFTSASSLLTPHPSASASSTPSFWLSSSTCPPCRGSGSTESNSTHWRSQHFLLTKQRQNHPIRGKIPGTLSTAVPTRARWICSVWRWSPGPQVPAPFLVPLLHTQPHFSLDLRTI
ncbi:uncharacterized protein RHO17_002585 [Thomomys bottae]